MSAPAAGRDVRAGPRSGRVVVAALVGIVGVGLALRFRGDASVWLTTGLSAAASVAAALWAGRGRLRDRVHVDARSTAIGLGAAAAMSAATWILYPLAEGWFPWLEPLVRDLYASLDDPPGRIAALPILALVVTAEELVFRDVLMTALRDRFPALLAGAIAVLLYVLPQVIGGSWLLVAVAFSCGIVWTALRMWTGDLWAPWLCHLLWDLAVFVAFPVEG